jgi:hypothetical protein
MINLRHKILVHVTNRKGEKENVMHGTILRLPRKLLKLLFGDIQEIMLVTPGKTVAGFEIKEVGMNGGDHNAAE